MKRVLLMLALLTGVALSARQDVGLVILATRVLADGSRSLLLNVRQKDLGAAGPDSDFGYGLLDVCRATARVSNRQLTCR